MEAMKIIRSVCEHAQASGMIKSLHDANQVSQALQSIAKCMDELQELRVEVIQLKSEKANAQLHS